MTHPTLILGWKEWVALPVLGITAMRAKMDTGAKTSSVHAYDLEVFKRQDKEYIRFALHPLKGNKHIICKCEAPLLGWRQVKNTGGEVESRPVITTTLSLGGRGWPIELNLTKRDYMGFGLLIGRQAMDNHVMIHAGASYMHGKMTNKKAALLYTNS